MRRMILVPLLIVVIVLAVAGSVAYYIYNNYLYYTTDDAQLTSPIVSVNAPASGQLTTLSVKQGDRVSQGQVIGTITPAATVDNATPKAVDLTSPIAGTIVNVSGVQNQAVAAGLGLVEVTNLNNMSITAYVDESQINNIKNGQDVDVHIDAYGDTSYTGKVQSMTQATAGSFALLPTQDNASGNFTKVSQRVPVVISLDGNGGKDLVPGLSAEVTIHIH